MSNSLHLITPRAQSTDDALTGTTTLGIVSVRTIFLGYLWLIVLRNHQGAGNLRQDKSRETCDVILRSEHRWELANYVWNTCCTICYGSVQAIIHISSWSCDAFKFLSPWFTEGALLDGTPPALHPWPFFLAVLLLCRTIKVENKSTEGISKLNLHSAAAPSGWKKFTSTMLSLLEFHLSKLLSSVKGHVSASFSEVLNTYVKWFQLHWLAPLCLKSQNGFNMLPWRPFSANRLDDLPFLPGQ